MPRSVASRGSASGRYHPVWRRLACLATEIQSFRSSQRPRQDAQDELAILGIFAGKADGVNIKGFQPHADDFRGPRAVVLAAVVGFALIEERVEPVLAAALMHRTVAPAVMRQRRAVVAGRHCASFSI